jgi:hypothetical protein
MPTTEGGLDMKLNLTHAIDGFSGNEHSMPITPQFKDVVQLWTRSGIFYTPTFIAAYGGPWAETIITKQPKCTTTQRCAASCPITL